MTIDPNETLRFKRSVVRTLLLVSLGIPFVILGYVLTTGMVAAPGGEVGGMILGILFIISFGGFGLYGLVRLILKPNEFIEIGPEGIRDARISANWLPWSKITGISTWSSRGASMIMLELDESFEASLKQSPLYRAYRFANALFGAQGHCLNPMGFGVSYRDLRATLRAYANAHDAPAAKD